MTALRAALLAALLAPPLAADEIGGRVESGAGVAVEHAKVTAVASGAATYSDHLGRFTVTACPLPCLLLVTHPRFEERALELAELPADGLEIVLDAKQAVYERIDVTATRGASDGFTPVSVASVHLRPEDRAAAPTTLTELVEGAPGVAENGQGGLFQVFAIRGVSRHRVLTLVAGMPITGERRAGVSTSFIDPLLIGSVDVLRGPASTYYGSGALGGVAQVFPGRFDGLRLAVGGRSFGDEHHLHAGWGDAETGWSVGLARRSAGNDDGADGRERNSHFTQTSAVVQKTWDRDGRSFELLVIPAVGRDIGKPNTDFPQRTTDYPAENHLLLKLATTGPEGGSFQVFAHPNDLRTEVLQRPQGGGGGDLQPGESLTEVENQSFDFGFSWQRPWSLNGERTAADPHGSWGVDVFSRRGVDAEERLESLADGPAPRTAAPRTAAPRTAITSTRTLDGATQDEAAAYGTVRWSWGAATFQAGGRLTVQRQTNGDAGTPDRPARDDSAWTGFAGLVRPLGKGYELTANLGTGLRFPNLSERFFTGTTGRGQVIGNPDLEPESSWNVDLGLRWYGSKAFWNVQTFQLRIADYIERVDVEDDTRTFVNLTSGTIRGVEIEGFYQLAERWLLSWSGHLLAGEASDGGPLADVSPDRLQAAVEYDHGDWQGRLELQHRAAKDDPGSGEVALRAADLVSASLSYRITPALALSLRGRNLLDEEYRSSADDKTAIAPGRSVGVGLTWSAP